MTQNAHKNECVRIKTKPPQVYLSFILLSTTFIIMETYKVSQNDVFYWVISISLQIQSFMLINASKMNKNALNGTIVSLFKFCIISFLISVHDNTKTNNINVYKLILLIYEMHTKINTNALKHQY
jgi:hypothetical protein